MMTDMLPWQLICSTGLCCRSRQAAADWLCIAARLPLGANAALTGRTDWPVAGAGSARLIQHQQQSTDSTRNDTTTTTTTTTNAAAPPRTTTSTTTQEQLHVACCGCDVIISVVRPAGAATAEAHAKNRCRAAAATTNKQKA